MIEDIQRNARQAGIAKAVRTGDTPRIFDWLLETFSYQGISDQVARAYLARHGNASWQTIASRLAINPSCRKLQSYWQFDRCRYDKGSCSCSEPDHFDGCPLPRHPLRNGRLNQTAYSFFLFVRDIAKGDLVGWIDHQLSMATQTPSQGQPLQPLIDPLRHVYGVSDKILTMALSSLLMAAPEEKPIWFDAGKTMIAVDTLVHNFLHRSGILTDFETSHSYGPGCYAPGGCADIIRMAAVEIDARRFNPTFPEIFPRFVQHAIWRYCAGEGLNICNGNQIDDRKSCQNSFCQLFNICRKTPLKAQ